ncbi:dihydropteroate synthase [Sedimentitalea sp. HM32M-2]|uniref:dihydropteroate synthase n=1 Tax=Sedimentitalea sp. HM32M-2 TaxID=3351566 RepID=UPI00362992FA
MLLAGGPLWFTHAQVLQRNVPSRLVHAQDLPPELSARLTAPRAAIAGLDMSQPCVMGILNVTPDSFSDGGLHAAPADARRAARQMVQDGAAVIDVGGESTRPGAAPVPAAAEIERIEPVLRAIRQELAVPVSVDTRKAAVARAALDAGATLVNDVSGLTHDAELAGLCAKRDVPVCIMHAQGDPQTMQQDPRYDDVLLDVYDFLEGRIRAVEAKGLARNRILVDPGIGFGKTERHNLTLLRNISLFHGLGCAILLGVSRKRFIGSIGRQERAETRAPGSIAVGLAALGQGVQILRVHDVADTVQALRLWMAVR